MGRFAAITLFLFFLALEAGITQQPQKAEKKYDVKRCTPKVVSKQPTGKSKTVQTRKGERATGYSPIIAFEILESGEVANAHVKRSSGITDLDTSALTWIQQMKYNSRPGCGVIEVDSDVLIHFR